LGSVPLRGGRFERKESLATESLSCGSGMWRVLRRKSSGRRLGGSPGRWGSASGGAVGAPVCHDARKSANISRFKLESSAKDSEGDGSAGFGSLVLPSSLALKGFRLRSPSEPEA